MHPLVNKQIASRNPPEAFLILASIWSNVTMETPDEARRRAEEDHRRNQQTQMATEQAIRDADARNAYNAELDRQRRADEERRRHG